MIKCELSGCLSRLVSLKKKQRIRSFFIVVDSKYPFAIQSLMPDNGPGCTPALVAGTSRTEIFSVDLLEKTSFGVFLLILIGIITKKSQQKYRNFKLDELAKSHKIPFFVIPAEAGIQSFQSVAEQLDSGFHRSDDFLRVHQTYSKYS